MCAMQSSRAGRASRQRGPINGRKIALPTRDDLDRANARTATAMADPDKCPADRLRSMAQLEAVQHHQYLKRPGADAELQRDAERELAEYDRGGRAT